MGAVGLHPFFMRCVVAKLFVCLFETPYRANAARELSPRYRTREATMPSSSPACASQPLTQTFVGRRPSQRRSTGDAPVALVTGAAGFIGSHVAEACATRLGFTVVAVDDLSGGFARNLEPWVSSGHSRFVLGDVQNRSFVSALFAEHGPFDYVYHLAAYAAEGLSHFVREFNYNNNLGASVLLLNHAVNQEERTGRAVARFVFTSSIAAFGAVEDPSELPMTEATPQRPEDPYGIAKHAFELDLRAAGRMFGLPFTIFRPHNVYGPRQNVADKFRNAVGIFMNQVLRAEPLSIFGDGRQTRCFSYVDDVAPIIAASVLYPATAGEVLALALALVLAWYWHWHSYWYRYAIATGTCLTYFLCDCRRRGLLRRCRRPHLGARARAAGRQRHGSARPPRRAPGRSQ